MVAAGKLFLLCLSALSYNCCQGYSTDVRRHATPLFDVKSPSSSRSSGPRPEDRIKSSLSAQSAGVEGQIDDGVNSVGVQGWEKRYLLLKRFQEREGHCNVPQLHKEDGANLGTWVDRQRQLKRKEKLKSDRQKMLEEIGFEWVLIERSVQVPWEERFYMLNQFKKREGHCNVPQSHKEDGINLGAGVSAHRELKKTKKLDPYRVSRLEEIGFEWANWVNVPWEERFDLLNQFKEREGHCSVPRSHKEDGANLGTWVNSQRQAKKTGKLAPDRQKMLEEVGFEWGGRYKV